jgi:hypothetical protein
MQERDGAIVRQVFKKEGLRYLRFSVSRGKLMDMIHVGDRITWLITVYGALGDRLLDMALRALAGNTEASSPEKMLEGN